MTSLPNLKFSQVTSLPKNFFFFIAQTSCRRVLSLTRCLGGIMADRRFVPSANSPPDISPSAKCPVASCHVPLLLYILYFNAGILRPTSNFTSDEYRAWLSRTPSTSAIYDQLKSNRDNTLLRQKSRFTFSAENLPERTRQVTFTETYTIESFPAIYTKIQF